MKDLSIVISGIPFAFVLFYGIKFVNLDNIQCLLLVAVYLILVFLYGENNKSEVNFTMTEKDENKNSENTKDNSIPVVKGTPSVKTVNSTIMIVMVMWGAIVLYSFGVSYVTGCHWWEMIAHYFCAMLAFYVWHWQAHRSIPWIPFNTKCKHMHMEHHFKVYPPSHFFGKKDESVLVKTHESFFTEHEALLYLLLIFIMITAYFLGEKPAALVFAFIFDSIIGYVGNALHQSFHVKGHWLENYEWYHELRAVHYVHHLGSTNFNYAVFNIGIDYLVGSLVLYDPRKKKQPNTEDKNIQLPSSSMGGMITTFLGLQNIPRKHGDWALKRGLVTCIFRILILYSFSVLWTKTENYFSTDNYPVSHEAYRDLGFASIEKASNPNQLLTALGISTDFIVIVIVLFGAFGPNIRPLVSLMYAILIRQAILYLGSQPNPIDSLWTKPLRYESLFIKYDSNEQSISGIVIVNSIIISEIFTILPENKQFYKIITVYIGLILLCCNMYSLLALRAIYSINILLSLLVSRYVTIASCIHCEYLEGLLP